MKNGKVIIVQSEWLATTREFYRWKKTPEFAKWKRKQFLKQGGLCWYCQEFLPMTRINVEHRMPRSKGGGNNKGNLVLACSSCNKAKGAEKLSSKERKRLYKQNENLKGTYLKNKRHFQNVYGSYSDQSLYELFSSL